MYLPRALNILCPFSEPLRPSICCLFTPMCLAAYHIPQIQHVPNITYSYPSPLQTCSVSHFFSPIHSSWKGVIHRLPLPLLSLSFPIHHQILAILPSLYIYGPHTVSISKASINRIVSHLNTNWSVLTNPANEKELKPQGTTLMLSFKNIFAGRSKIVK